MIHEASTNCSKVRFRSKDDFICQATSLLRDFMPTHALDIVTLLLGFVLNTEDWMREKSMQVLKLVLQSSEARAPLQAHGNELLQPLLRLLFTKHASQALDVLDMPVTAATTAEASSSNSPGSTGEIFGLIEESGWSVPRIKELSALTRENVRAVFNTCATETRAASAHFSVMQSADMRAFGPNASQISLDIPSSPPISGAMENASIGDLVGALHSLGNFFEDGDTAGGAGTTSPNPSFKMGSRHGQSGSDLSERRVRAIMARSRQQSISSPIYENSPSHSLINGAYRPHKHHHTRSDAMASESSITSSSMDERDNVTQRLNFTAHANGNGDGRTLGHIHLPSNSVSSMSDVGDQSWFGLEDEVPGQAGAASIPTSGSAVDFNCGGGGRGARQGAWETALEKDRSEQNTPVLAKRTAVFDAGGS
ncbi:hypothetical protein IAT38_000049 [Cryptococcus sp. DSM 104549]